MCSRDVLGSSSSRGGMEEVVQFKYIAIRWETKVHSAPRECFWAVCKQFYFFLAYIFLCVFVWSLGILALVISRLYSKKYDLCFFFICCISSEAIRECFTRDYLPHGESGQDFLHPDLR